MRSGARPCVSELFEVTSLCYVHVNVRVRVHVHVFWICFAQYNDGGLPFAVTTLRT